jgi:hypothetical protein
LTPFSTIPFFGKVAKRVPAAFSLLLNFSKHIRNPAKILVLPKFGKVYFSIKVNSPLHFELSSILSVPIRFTRAL